MTLGAGGHVMMNEDQPDLEVTLSPLFWLLHGTGHTWLSTFYIHLHQQLGLWPGSGEAQILMIFLVLKSLVLTYLGKIYNGLSGVCGVAQSDTTEAT